MQGNGGENISALPGSGDTERWLLWGDFLVSGLLPMDAGGTGTATVGRHWSSNRSTIFIKTAQGKDFRQRSGRLCGLKFSGL